MARLRIIVSIPDEIADGTDATGILPGPYDDLIDALIGSGVVLPEDIDVRAEVD
jgi:hypothetical protein